jgi:hypothetical protein
MGCEWGNRWGNRKKSEISMLGFSHFEGGEKLGEDFSTFAA